MKFAISAVTLFVLFGSAVSTHAQEKKQEEHHDQSKSAQHEAKPAHEQHQQAKPAEHQQTHESKPAEHQHTQQAAHSDHQQSHPENHAQNNNHPQNQSHAQHASYSNQSRAGYSHGGRISDAHYNSNFGREHSFHVNRGDYDHRHFAYGGYSWGFVDPWPVAWGYSDDVYVVYADGGYYMYNRAHSGVRIAININ